MSESGEEWELSKENIRPIQQGRKQKALKVALASHPEDVITQERQSFENELRTYSGNDPLSVWCKYIKWVEQNFPKGGREGHIKQLMERCLSILKDEKKYFDDHRFVDIMLKYAGFSSRPLDVYNHMYSNKIGCQSAEFFINWSWELEQLGNLKKADEVITEGIQRRAQPSEKMKAYQKDFEIRFTTRLKAKVEAGDFEQEDSHGRSAFTSLKPQKKNLAPIRRTGEAVIDKKNPLVLNRSQPQPKSAIASARIPFKIYDAENINPSLPVQTQSAARNTFNPESHKENEQKPSKWSKVKLKSHQNFKPAQEVNPNFKLHCDDEKDEQICTPRSVPRTSNILSVHRRSPSPPIALFEPPDPMKRPMYPKNKVYGGATEYSLEEIRAAAWFESKKKIEQERLLVEQQEKIKEHAKNEEKLKKQVEYLAKKVELLQSLAVTGSNAKSCEAPSASEVKLITSDMTLNNHLLDVQRQASGILKEGSRDMPFTFYQDPTTKVLHSEDIVSSDGLSTNKLESHRDTSEFSDKLSFPFFHDKTSNSSSQDFANLKENAVKIVSQESSKSAFSFYTDPTGETSNSNEIATSNKHSQYGNQSSLADSYRINVVASKESNENMPFPLYHDPTETISNLNKITSAKGPISATSEQKFTEESEEDIENIPPQGYVQNPIKRELEGILEPSKNILFIPLEEQELEDDEDSEFEDYVYQKQKQCADYTLIPPSNTEQFSTAKFLASTPFVPKSIKGSNKENLEDEVLPPKENVQEEACLPVENHSDKKQFINDEHVKSEQKSFKEPMLNLDTKSTNFSRLPNILSAIMETSREAYSKSSSGSSASLTKSNHLDQNSAHHISEHKQHSKAQLCELSTVSEVSNLYSELISETTKKNDKDVTKDELHTVDLDPFDQKITQKLLKSIDLNKYKNIYHTNMSIKAVRIGEQVQIGNEKYFIDSLISEGAYAKVYKAIKPFETYSSENKNTLALKVCKKANEWEFYICNEVQRRLQAKNLLPDIKNSVLNIIAATNYPDGIILLNEFSDLGTLLDVINFYKKQGSTVPEFLIMFFTLEMLHIVSKLHKCRIIHGDIKPDNFLLKSLSSDGGILEKLSKSTTCLRLIDFGRGIDLGCFDRGICFTSTLATDHFKCTEMKEQRPWVFQLDWYGVLSCIHSMLFMEYMKVTKKNGEWGLEKKFKRYWFTSLWEPLFRNLLNIPECYEEPDISYFTGIIEAKLQQNAAGFVNQFNRLSNTYLVKR